MAKQWAVGERVYWVDPGDGLASGPGVITSINVEPGAALVDDTVVHVDLDDGGQAEVLPGELQPGPAAPQARVAPATVYVLLHDMQNEHGYVDTDILGVYASEAQAEAAEVEADTRLQAEPGRRVTGREADWGKEDEGDWTDCHRIETAEYFAAPADEAARLATACATRTRPYDQEVDGGYIVHHAPPKEQA